MVGYLFEVDENGEFDFGDVLDILFGYLINLKVEFVVDEDIVVNFDFEVIMGLGLILEMGYW